MPLLVHLYYSGTLSMRSYAQDPDPAQSGKAPSHESGPGTAHHAVEAAGVAKSFGRNEVLRGLHLTIEWGEAVAVLGPNGSGKSTLVRLLSGLSRPDSGDIRVAGLDPARHGEMVRRTVGVMTHEPLLYDDLTGWENLEFAGRMFQVDRVGERIEAVAERLGVHPRLHQRVGSLSHGLRKRFSIARALLHEPRVLLMDEPESGLDGRAAAILEEVLRDRTSSGGALLFTTHDLDWAAERSDRIAIVGAGRVSHLLAGGDRAAARDAYSTHAKGLP